MNNDIDYFKSAEEKYKALGNNLKIFEIKFFEEFKIPLNITQDSIKRILVETISENGAKSISFKRQSIFLFFLLFFLASSFYLFMSIFGRRASKKVQKGSKSEKTDYHFQFNINLNKHAYAF